MCQALCEELLYVAVFHPHLALGGGILTPIAPNSAPFLMVEEIY